MSVARAISLLASPELLARIGGPYREVARANAHELETKTKRAETLAHLRTPLPMGIRNIHATWIEAALADLPPRARVVLANPPPTKLSQPVDVWLARWATATFPIVQQADASIVRPRCIDDVGQMSARALRAWLDDVGADQLAFAVGDQAAKALGPLVARAAQRIAEPPRRDELGLRRAAIERAKVEIDEVALLRIAGRAIAPHIAELPTLGAELAHRLPRPVGLVLATELAAYANSPIANAPTWTAITAP